MSHNVAHFRHCAYNELKQRQRPVRLSLWSWVVSSSESQALLNFSFLCLC